MKRISTTPTVLPSTNMGAVGKAWDEVSASFDRFCLAAGIDALGAMMEKDAEEACGARHARSEERRGHRWGRTQGKLGFHAGKVTVERPRVRDLSGQELSLPSWDRAASPQIGCSLRLMQPFHRNPYWQPHAVCQLISI